jgi:hypothetical protein
MFFPFTVLELNVTIAILNPKLHFYCLVGSCKRKKKIGKKKKREKNNFFHLLSIFSNIKPTFCRNTWQGWYDFFACLEKNVRSLCKTLLRVFVEPFLINKVGIQQVS